MLWLRTRSTSFLSAVIALWGVGLGSGFGLWMAYDATPGETPTPPATWPDGTTITRAEADYRLLVFAHPHCPCTQATLKEVERLLVELDHLVAHVLLCVPPGVTDPEWKRSAFCQQVEANPHTRLQWDRDCREARRFGVTTSGHVLLFHPDGRLLFSGGVTRTRGAVGENPATQALRDRLRGGCTDFLSTPVYGCPLFNSPISDS